MYSCNILLHQEDITKSVQLPIRAALPSDSVKYIIQCMSLQITNLATTVDESHLHCIASHANLVS